MSHIAILRQERLSQFPDPDHAGDLQCAPVMVSDEECVPRVASCQTEHENERFI